MSKVTKKKRKKTGASVSKAPLERVPRPEADDDVVDAKFDDVDEPSSGPAPEPSDDHDADEPEAAQDEAADDEAAQDEAAQDGAADDEAADDDGADDDESLAAREGSDEDEAPAATQLGAARWVAAGFFALWLLSAYVVGQALAGVWSWASNRDFFSRNFAALAAIPHEGELVSRKSISLVLSALITGLITFRYFRKPSVRSWADDVADELRKVTWPVRKAVWEDTIVVIAVSAVITLYLTVLDRFWGFLTSLIYTTGA